jgi:hypothetical protein
MKADEQCEGPRVDYPRQADPRNMAPA